MPDDPRVEESVDVTTDEAGGRWVTVSWSYMPSQSWPSTSISVQVDTRGIVRFEGGGKIPHAAALDLARFLIDPFAGLRELLPPEVAKDRTRA